MNISVTVDGQKQFSGAVDAIAKGISDFRPVWPEIELAFFRLELEQFNSEGSRGGSRWKPLSEKYRKWKERHYPGKPILQRSGRLLRSLSVIGGGDSIREQEPLSLTLGSRVPYATYHQRGAGKLPQRPPMQIQRDDYGKFVSRMFRYAETVARDAGFAVTAPGGFAE
jgi:phage gpG-like protein